MVCLMVSEKSLQIYSLHHIYGPDLHQLGDCYIVWKNNNHGVGNTQWGQKHLDQTSRCKKGAIKGDVHTYTW